MKNNYFQTISRKNSDDYYNNLSEEEKQEYQDIKAAYESLESQESNKISLQHLEHVLQPDYLEKKEAHTLNNNPLLREVIEKLVAEQKDVDFDQFYWTIQQTINQIETESDIRKIFRLFTESEDSSTITINNLKTVAKNLQEHITQEELTELIEKITQDGSGNSKEILFSDFKRIFEKKFNKQYN